MGMMDNFKQAIADLTGQEAQKAGPESPNLAGDQNSASAWTQKEKTSSPSQDRLAYDGSPNPSDSTFSQQMNSDVHTAQSSMNAEIPVQKRYTDTAHNPGYGSDLLRSDAVPAARSEMTIISKGTVISGSIKSFDPLDIHGIVKGDVASTKQLLISGKVEGDVTGQAVRLIDCSIAGAVVSDGLLELSKDSFIMGDVQTVEIISDGKIKGDLNIKGLGSFKTNSVILGNVNVGTLMIEAGAKMKGFINNLTGDDDAEEKLFSE